MATYYAVTAGGTWASSTTWASSSGGAGGAGVPTASDDVILDSNSGNVTIGAAAACRSLDCTAGTGNYVGTLTIQTFTLTIGTSTVNPSNVALKLSSGMLLSFTTGSAITFNSSSATTVSVTCAGQSLCFVNSTASDGTVSFQGGGKYSLADAFACGGPLSVSAANTTLTTTSNVSCWNFTSGSAAGVTVNMGSGTWTITANNAGVTLWSNTCPNFNAQTSTIVMQNGPAGNTLGQTFAGGGKTYNNLVLGIASNPAQHYVVTGANSFNTLTVAPGTWLVLPASTTTTVTTFTVNSRHNGYIWSSGVGGGAPGYISSASSSALNVSGNITIDVCASVAIWATTAAVNILLSKWNVTGNQRSYQLYLDNNSKLNLGISKDGVASSSWTTSVVTGFAAGSTNWVRASLVLNNGSNSVCQFFSSSDGITWTQMGTNVTGATVTGIFNSTSDLELGWSSVASTNPLLNAGFYRARIFASALGSGSGTPVYDADFTSDRMAQTVGSTGGYQDTAKTQFLENSSNTATVNLNTGLIQQGDGRVTISSSTPGTQATISVASGIVNLNYLSLQDSAATGGATFYAGVASANISNNSGWLFSSPPAGGFFRFM